MSAVVLLAGLVGQHAQGQVALGKEPLPHAPAVAQRAPAKDQVSSAQERASIEGVVLDVQGAAVPGARVTLTAPGKFDSRVAIGQGDGRFVFPAVPAGVYRLTVAAEGLQTLITPEFVTKAGQTTEAPRIVLSAAGTSSSVQVTATVEQIAEAQVSAEEKQRVLGVFPNFYTSYIWKAEPMSTKQKYKLAVRAMVDPVNFLLTAGVAGAEQYNGTYPGYGPGIGGYGKRYAAAYGDTLSSRIIGSAVLPSLLHQDPRYFYQGSGGVRSRASHAVASTFICRGDRGTMQPNYSHLLGSLAAGGIANAYHPASSRGAGLTFETFAITTGANMVGNLIREFVLRGLVPSVPDFANGK